MLRLLVILLGLVTAHSPGQRGTARRWADDPDPGQRPAGLLTEPGGPASGGPRPGQPQPLPPQWHPPADGPGGPASPGGPGRGVGPRRRRRVPATVKWVAAVAAVGLIFRRAIAYVLLVTLSAALHLVGINVHLPSIRFAWPWQSISAGTTTNADLGPWVLQKIEGISKPALGEANFSFFFTHKVSKSIGIWPCWYASTFYAVGHASATVDLNPGPAWWAPAAGHYRLQVLSRPRQGRPGHVTIAMVLPRPQLPQSAHDVTIDNIPSKPIDTQHSWTYPGFGCGVLLRPQFPESVLYSQAQHIAFYKASHAPQVTHPLIASAEAEAAQTIRDNFIQPTVNAFGYALDQFTIRWAGSP
ncbi:MAG TPA: hypothetical protein VMV92_30640 [Streptosporangiaceae bacterium]|nr:hypothetical protein [Streptosporangiaceae bacterium]